MKVMVRMLRSPWALGLPRLRHSTRSGRAFVLRRRERGRSSPESTGMRLLPYVDDFLALRPRETWMGAGCADGDLACFRATLADTLRAALRRPERSRAAPRL